PVEREPAAPRPNQVHAGLAPGLGAEPRLPPDPEPLLEGAVLFSVADRGPDEHRAGDRDRYDDDEQDEDHDADCVHALSVPCQAYFTFYSLGSKRREEPIWRR